jgi:hypothetical protein
MKNGLLVSCRVLVETHWYAINKRGKLYLIFHSMCKLIQCQLVIDETLFEMKAQNISESVKITLQLEICFIRQASNQIVREGVVL